MQGSSEVLGWPLWVHKGNWKQGDSVHYWPSIRVQRKAPGLHGVCSPRLSLERKDTEKNHYVSQPHTTVLY